MRFKANNFWVAVLCPLQWLALRKRFDGTAVGELTVPDAEGEIMWLLLVIEFWAFAGVVDSFDKQSEGIQLITCATLLANLALFAFYVVNPSAVTSGIHSATGF